MTHKNAFADLGIGGGKATLAPKRRDFSREQLFRTLGRCVAKLGGAYITAEDVGTVVDDMLIVREETEQVVGLPAKDGGAGGDPSPWTALGVFESMKAAVEIQKGDGLNGLTVASVVKWSQRQRAVGSPAALKMGGRRPYVVEDWLLARIAEKPDLTLRALLKELADRLGGQLLCALAFSSP